MKPQRRKRKRFASSIAVHLALGAGALVFTLPFIYMLLTSMMIQDEYAKMETWIPEAILHWPPDVDAITRNYRTVFEVVPYLDFFRNTVYVTIMSIIGQVLACSCVAYAFARLQWVGRDIVFILVLATLMLPQQVTLIPVFLIFRAIGWYNTLRPLWVPAFFGSAFFIFLLRQFFLTLPKSLEDAARIDGCGHLRTLVEIMLPLMKPALAAIVVFQFMNAWNDFLTPMIYINDDRLTTLSVGLHIFAATRRSLYGEMMAATAMMLIPVMIVFFMAQKHFVEGVTLTGMRE